MTTTRMPILLLSLAATGAVFAEPPSKGASYVALGSSFAAGPGIETQLESCGRSDRNYPHLVAAALGQQLQDAMVGAAKAKGALVADPYALAKGHGPCDGTRERSLRGLTA